MEQAERTEQKTLKDWGQEVAELEAQRRALVREVADAEWKASKCLPSERADARLELQTAQRELSEVLSKLQAARLTYQKAECVVNGLRIARANLRAHLRPHGYFDQMITLKAEALRALPGGAALLEAEYKAAVENKQKAAQHVDQLDKDIAVLEG